MSTAALLKKNLTATLYTEVLVSTDKSRKDLLDRILCGNFSTLSMLLGLFPVEYWSNTTAVSSLGEIIADALQVLSRMVTW